MITLIAILVTSMSFSVVAFAATVNCIQMPVNKVSDISMLSVATNIVSCDNACEDVVEGERSYDYYYQFTLTKPSYIWLDMYSDVLTRNYAGSTQVYIGKTPTTCTEQLFSMNANGVSGSYRHLFEAGTYYIKATIIVDEPTISNGAEMIKDSKSLSFTLYAQELSRDNNAYGMSMETAIVMKDFKGRGVVSKDVRSQWFKFTIDSKSDVDFATTFMPPSTWTKSSKGEVRLYNANGEEIGSCSGGSFDAGAWVEEHELRTNISNSVKELPAGTYYICVNLNAGVYPVDVKLNVKDVYAPNKPKAVNYKSGNKFVKGNAEKGSTVYVKYNGKTTKAKTDKYGVYKVNTSVLKVGKTVQIWAKDAKGNKSKVTKVTVKNRQIAKPKVKTYKKNTKLVKGTGKKGTTVYVTYAGKTYKKKLTSSSYSVKVNKKLTKGASIKVKVMDSYGNYSKTVTVKVK